VPVEREATLKEFIRSQQNQIADKQHKMAIHEQIGILWKEGEELESIALTSEKIIDAAALKVEWTSKVEGYLHDVGLLDEEVGFKTIPDFKGKLSKLRKIWMRAASRAKGNL
jgi:hypothetical protein